MSIATISQGVFPQVDRLTGTRLESYAPCCTEKMSITRSDVLLDSRATRRTDLSKNRNDALGAYLRTKSRPRISVSTRRTETTTSDQRSTSVMPSRIYPTPTLRAVEPTRYQSIGAFPSAEKKEPFGPPALRFVRNTKEMVLRQLVNRRFFRDHPPVGLRTVGNDWRPTISTVPVSAHDGVLAARDAPLVSVANPLMGAANMRPVIAVVPTSPERLKLNLSNMI